MRDFQLALRNLRKSPFVSFVAVLSLALGIGANGAIFSLFDQMLLADLPVPAPDQLVDLGAPGPKPGSQSCNDAGDCDEVFSYPMFRDLESGQTVLSGLAAHRLFGANLASEGRTSSGTGMLVSGSYFPTLGLRPALGRLLAPGDDPAVGEARVVVLSHDFWRTRFGADPGVVGRGLIVNGQSLAIVGVAPAGFRGTTLGARPEVYVPITLHGLMTPGFDGFDNRRSYWAYLFGRLRPGVTREQARDALDRRYHALINDVEAPLQKGMSDATMERFRARRLEVEPGRRGQSSLHQRTKTPLLLLFAVTGVVLLIACANIANLLLVRGAARRGEMAVRLAVGARSGALVRQLLTESCLLAALGGAAGIAFAYWTLALIRSLLPADTASFLAFSLDLRAIAFAAALALVTGVLSGLFPALHSTRPDLATTLRGQAGQPAGARSAARFRAGLVAAQIALSTALLAAAGLFLESLVNISRIDLGLEIDHLVTFSISPELNGYSPERSRALFARAEEELGGLPGVKSVSASMVPLLAGNSWGNDVQVEGFVVEPDTDNNARLNEIGPGFVHTVGMTLVAGREFTVADAAGAPKVAIVNQAFAKKFGLGRAVVGKRMGLSGPLAPDQPSGGLDVEIVGLVEDAKYSRVKDEVPPEYFTPYRQDDAIGSIYFYLRTVQAPATVVASIPGVVTRLDPNLPVDDLKTMPQQVRDNTFLDRLLTTLSAAFAVLATLLAAVGLYGVLAYSVAQRTREIGLRMALGADGGRVRRMVLAQVGRLTLVGGLVGLAAAAALGQAAGSLLYGLTGHEPAIFSAASALLATVALGAGLAPAIRASRTDPLHALRYE